MNLRPMLAQKIEENNLDFLHYPIYLQIKLDGIRCLVLEGKAVSRTLKAIPNKYVKSRLEDIFKMAPFLIDGELILRNKISTFNEIQSAIMSEEGCPDFLYVIFDCLIRDIFTSYEERLKNIDTVIPINNFRIEKLGFIKCYNKGEILMYEKKFLYEGHEGIILRSPAGHYKFGRSTLKEEYLLKMKRFEDSEAEILDSFALERNSNEAELDERGYTKRSSKQDGLEIEETLGSWKVKDCNEESPFFGEVFHIGSGFTQQQRDEYWRNRKNGKIIKYKYQAFGSKNLPRTPIFLGFSYDK